MLAQIATPLFINNIGPWGILLIAVVALVLFGRGKVAGLMGEVGKGITSFKRGLKEGSDEITDQRDEVTPPVGTPVGTPGTAARDVTPPRNRDNA